MIELGPPFEWLGMEHIETLTHYVQSLGLKMADTRMERQRHWKQASIKAYEPVPKTIPAGSQSRSPSG